MLHASKSTTNCDPCHTEAGTNKTKVRTGLLTGIALAVLPKCPFCVMAYSSTLLLCTEGAGMHHGIFSSTNLLIITVLFCAIALVSILLNYRDRRTAYAFLLAALGSAVIILSVTVTINLPLYYFGIALLFSGIWLNASLLSFVRKVKQYLAKPGTNSSV